MHTILPNLQITPAEYKCLQHIESDPELWLLNMLLGKAEARKKALIKAWIPRLIADPSVIDIPANESDLIQLIMAHSEYRDCEQCDTDIGKPTAVDNRIVFEGKKRRGPNRDVAKATVVFISGGLSITDEQYACIRAYVSDVEDWVLGALLGHINRGKKKMIAQYHPIIMVDPDVTITPATEEGLISMIVARDDYKMLA